MAVTRAEGVFSISSHEIPFFSFENKIVTCFIEWNHHILVLNRAKKESHPDTWCTPGGRCEKNEDFAEAIVREVFEETQIHLYQGSMQPIAICYMRSSLCGCDYSFGVFRKILEEKPTIKLNDDEHQASKWISREDFCSLHLMPFQKEIFETVY